MTREELDAIAEATAKAVVRELREQTFPGQESEAVRACRRIHELRDKSMSHYLYEWDCAVKACSAVVGVHYETSCLPPEADSAPVASPGGNTGASRPRKDGEDLDQA